MINTLKPWGAKEKKPAPMNTAPCAAPEMPDDACCEDEGLEGMWVLCENGMPVLVASERDDLFDLFTGILEDENGILSDEADDCWEELSTHHAWGDWTLTFVDVA